MSCCLLVQLGSTLSIRAVYHELFILRHSTKTTLVMWKLILIICCKLHQHTSQHHKHTNNKMTLKKVQFFFFLDPCKASQILQMWIHNWIPQNTQHSDCKCWQGLQLMLGNWSLVFLRYNLDQQNYCHSFITNQKENPCSILCSTLYVLVLSEQGITLTNTDSVSNEIYCSSQRKVIEMKTSDWGS